MCEQYTQTSLPLQQAKQCIKCGEEKPFAAFHHNKRRADGYEPYCKECRSRRVDKEGYAQRVANRTLGVKQCTVCGTTKPLSGYFKQASQPDGHTPRCKACGKIAKAAKWAVSGAEESAKRRAVYRDNPEYRDAMRARRRAYYNANREKAVAATAAWVRAHPENYKRSHKKWEQSHVEIRREYVRRRYAARKAGRRVPFTLAQLRQKMAYWGNRCWMCGCEATEIDHVKPLSKGGLDILCNLRPACRTCNSGKYNTWPYPLIRNIPRW
jgi:5-methylcytosine-specific restriction endonuclease McrA